jgi:hypothetical protein
MPAFVAVIRNFNGRMYKTSRSANMLATPIATSVTNLRSYTVAWPQQKARFIAYGTSRMHSPLTRKVTSPFLGFDRSMHSIAAPRTKPIDGDDTLAPYGILHLENFPANDNSLSKASRKKVTLNQLRKKYKNGDKLTMITAYDAPTAALANEAGFDIILVGDSVG